MWLYYLGKKGFKQDHSSCHKRNGTTNRNADTGKKNKGDGAKNVHHQ